MKMTDGRNKDAFRNCCCMIKPASRIRETIKLIIGSDLVLRTENRSTFCQD